MSIELKTEGDLEAMKHACRVVAVVLDELEKVVAPGVSTWDLDNLSASVAKREGARCSFNGLYGFPGNLCTSINEVVVHGIPSRGDVLREGDIVGCDFGAEINGWYGDGTRTFRVGKVSPEVESLVQTAEEALYAGIEAFKVGGRVSDIGHTVQKLTEDKGYSVVRDLVGHGIGRHPHEGPSVPNFGQPGKGARLKVGMTLALEPMINMGTYKVETLSDGWTVVTKDRKWSAHFEHTVALTKSGPQILTVS